MALALVTILSFSLSSCSQSSSTEQIRATLFLLDASRSTIASVSARENQLRERLEGVFEKQEAIYFDFIRTDFTKQMVLPLISMQSVINIEDTVRTDAKDDRVRKDTRELIGRIWVQALNDSNTSAACSAVYLRQLTNGTVLSESGAKVIVRNLCVSAAKAKQTFTDIRAVGNGTTSGVAFIGSDIEGAFLRALNRLETESSNLLNIENQRVGVKATIVVSSDMMQRRSSGKRVIDEISGLNSDQVVKYVTESRKNLEIRTLRPNIIIDGWLTTKRNFSESERELLETYWKTWFTTLDLDEPDFGSGLVDWSVSQ